MKRRFFQAAVVLILLYGCITRTLTKRMEKRLDGNYTRMLRAILNKSWRQQPTKQQLYGHLPPITKTIQVWRTRHAGHYWRSRNELISDVLLWTPSHGRAVLKWILQLIIKCLLAFNFFFMAHEMIRIWLRSISLKREIVSSRKSSKCRFYSDGEETVNRILREYSRLAQAECRNRHDWVGKVSHMKLCKTLNFSLSDKWQMNKPESFL